jgi:polyhydroxyalkanoate synthesis regulator phasin
MSTFTERLLLMGMGGFAVAQDTVRDLMDDLVRRGEMSREDAQAWRGIWRNADVGSVKSSAI